MTSHSENGSRLDRIEAILLNLAGASVRHDNEFNRINAILDRNAQQIEALTHRSEANSQQIEALTHRSEANSQQIEALTHRIEALTHRIEALSHRIEALTHQSEANSQQIEANARQGALNQESIQTLTASIQDLRNLVADYIQGRSHP